MQAGEQIRNLQKLFNLRHGEKPADSDFPPRFYEEPAGPGPTAGWRLERAQVKRVLAEYCRA